MAERLCPDCQENGKCLFREYADKITAELRGRGIVDPEILIGAALEVHKRIAKARVKAREQMCPNLNDIDPDYPGRELL